MTARGWAIGATLVLGGLLAIAWSARGVARDLGTPRDLHGVRYVGSDACRRCHPQHHESWARTFHRTMTREASDETVLAPFDGREVRYGGERVALERAEDGAFLMRFLDDEGRETRRARVERTVGSHRHQQYLAREDDVFFRLPVAWDVEEGRLFHMNGAFLTADPEGHDQGRVAEADRLRHVVSWNDNCIFCHNVAPDPGLDARTGRFDSHVAELGVACEACHGPGGEHVEVNTSPLRRYALHLGLGDHERDPSIVSPSELPAARASEVCARCHGQRITDDVGAFLAHGDPFVPGDALERYSRPLHIDTTLHGERAFEARFWADGTPRLTAYEYQAMRMSACAQDASFGCGSCHSMHEGDPSGQLRPSLRGDAMCTSACHDGLRDAVQARAHAARSAAGVEGAHADVRCASCHMPRVVYGIRGIRISHRVDVPRPGDEARPDACSLCHHDERARALALGGDPIERAVAVAALEQARPDASARSERLGLLLDVMEHDAYPAVRGIAWRTLRAHAALDVELFTATDSRSERRAQIAAIERQLGEHVSRPDPEIALPLRARAGDRAIEIGE